MAAWSFAKIAAGIFDLLSVPVYWNDVYANWHMRAKAFFVTHSLLLELPHGDPFYFGGRVASYPLGLTLTKVWLAMVAGGLAPSRVEGWSEVAVNSLHVVLFLAFLMLFFFALLRSVRPFCALLGTFFLISLPLLLLHSSSAYSDIPMAAALFGTLHCFYQWMREEDKARARSWLLLFAASSAAMLFMKSEAMVLFLPPLALLFVWTACRKEASRAAALRTIGLFAGIVALLAFPWLVFKTVLHLDFGNQLSISNLTIALHSEVPSAMFHALVYTGSFLLLFPAYVLLLTLTVRLPRRDPLGILLLFLFLVFGLEFLMYTFTDIAIEAARQTAFSRSVLHLVPGVVFTGMVLLEELFGKESTYKRSIPQSDGS